MSAPGIYLRLTRRPITVSSQTSTLLANFFLALIFFPETQRRAQAELDAVIGRERLPSLDDCDVLPYIKAMYLELLRWRVISPLGECWLHQL